MERSLPSKYECLFRSHRDEHSHLQHSLKCPGGGWLHLLGSELQDGLHGVQAGSAEVGDVALHANGLQPLGDGSVGDPIRPTAAGQTERYPGDTDTLR